MSKRLKLTMTSCALAGMIGGLLGLIIGVESVPPDAGLEAGAIIVVWFVGSGFSLALLAGIFGWLMREEFLGKTIRYLSMGLAAMALIFAIWIWMRNSGDQSGDQPPPPGVSTPTTSPK